MCGSKSKRMTTRVARLYDEADDGACAQCGECCMVITLETISDTDAERLGKEFCYSIPGCPHWFGIRRVRRDWAPGFADEGVCVFLYPYENGFRCMARDERPSICRDFKCITGCWAYTLDWKILNDKFRIEYDGLDDEEKERRRVEVDEAYREKVRADTYIAEVNARRKGFYSMNNKPEVEVKHDRK